jgi:hypothetical protein
MGDEDEGLLDMFEGDTISRKRDHSPSDDFSNKKPKIEDDDRALESREEDGSMGKGSGEEGEVEAEGYDKEDSLDGRNRVASKEEDLSIGRKNNGNHKGIMSILSLFIFSYIYIYLRRRIWGWDKEGIISTLGEGY